MTVFRASESSINLMENILSSVLGSFQVCDGCMASTTYISMYSTIRDQIFRTIITLLRDFPNAEFHFSGHSLGGVFVTFIASDILSNLNYYDFDDYLRDPLSYSDTVFHSSNLRNQTFIKDGHNLRISDVYTFGMPRIGNRHFSDYIHMNIPNFYRITNDNDIIPFLPPLFMEFTHTGDEYWFKSIDELKICQYPESVDCIRSVKNTSIQKHSDYMGEVKSRCIYY